MKLTAALSTVLLTVSSTVKAANAKSDTLNVIPNFLPPTAFVSSSTDLFKDTASSTAKARQRGMDALITTEKTLEIKEIMGVLPAATSNENGNFLIRHQRLVRPPAVILISTVVPTVLHIQ